MLFEAQLLFHLPLAVAVYSPILAPFLSLILMAAFIGLLYLTFQTHVGRNVLGLIGGVALVDLLFPCEYSIKHHPPRHSRFHTHSRSIFEPPIHGHGYQPTPNHGIHGYGYQPAPNHGIHGHGYQPAPNHGIHGHDYQPSSTPQIHGHF